MTATNTSNYGEGDATYQALGGFNGIKQLVAEFYHIMDNEADFQTISVMHTEPDTLKKDKLLYFLCGWTGGPESYHQHFGKSISMPGAHAHLIIGVTERDMWLSCMAKALATQNYPEDLQRYLLQALSHPAEMIRRVSQQRHSQQ